MGRTGLNRNRISSTKRTARKHSGKTSSKGGAIGNGNGKKPLSTLTHEALHDYFASLNGHRPGDLYQLVLGEVEKPLFKVVMSYTNGNQSEAATILGINRGTLRKKLKTYHLIDG